MSGPSGDGQVFKSFLNTVSNKNTWMIHVGCVSFEHSILWVRSRVECPRSSGSVCRWQGAPCVCLAYEAFDMSRIYMADPGSEEGHRPSSIVRDRRLGHAGQGVPELSIWQKSSHAKNGPELRVQRDKSALWFRQTLPHDGTSQCGCWISVGEPNTKVFHA